MPFAIAASHNGISSSLSHLNRQVSPPVIVVEAAFCEEAGGCPSKTTKRHSRGDSQHRVAAVFSNGISASNDN